MKLFTKEQKVKLQDKQKVCDKKQTDFEKKTVLNSFTKKERKEGKNKRFSSPSKF